MVSCLPVACAIAILVPTPSVDAASTGSRYRPILSANRPAKPPMPPSTSGRLAFCGQRAQRRHGPLTGLDVHPGRRVGQARGVGSGTAGRHDGVLLSVGEPGRAAVRAGAARPLHRSRRTAGPTADPAYRCAPDRDRPRRHRTRRRPPRSRSSPGRPQLQQVLAEHGLLGQRDRVVAVEAGHAQPGARLLAGRDQALQRDVAQRVGADRPAHALGVQGAGHQLGPGGEVDPVEARPAHRRRGDPHVHLHRAGLAQHPDQRALGVAAHDRVVHHDQPLAPDDVAQRVELEPDAELPDGLRGLDEGAPDVGVLDQALAVGDAGALGVADRGRGAGLRRRDDQVGLDRVLPAPAGGRSPPAPRAPSGRRCWCPGGPGRRTRTRSPSAPARRTGSCACRPRRWRSARPARPRAPSWRR